MIRKKLISYSVNNYIEFYEHYMLEDYNITSVASFLNSTYNLDLEYSDRNEKYVVDVTTLVKSLLMRQDTNLLYENWIMQLSEYFYDIEFAVEENYKDLAFKSFVNYFEFADSDVIRNEENIEASKLIYHKKIHVYDKSQFEKYFASKKENDITIMSIASLIIKDNFFNLSIDENAIKQVNAETEIDISSLVAMLKIRSDIILSAEICIYKLMQMEKIDFCISKEYENVSKEILPYLFTEYEYISTTDLNQVKSNTNISIVEYETQELDKFYDKFDKTLFGHSTFKHDLKRKLKNFSILNKMERSKIFSMLLCGDSGTGKTEVARLMHNYLYPSENIIKINFGNYSGKGSLWSLIGSPKGYVGSEEGGELTNKIENSKSKIILIDEFEKADESIYTFFYEMLEDGKYTDLDGKVIDLNGYIIVFTANLNQDNYQQIPEPLMSRFDMTYEFVTLSADEKMDFIIYTTKSLIDDYNKIGDNQVDENILKEILRIPYQSENNLRKLKRGIINKFIEVVEEQNHMQ